MIMKLRPFVLEKDYDYLQSWITDERTHALWCANLLPYPLTKESLEAVLEKDAMDWGGKAYSVLDDKGCPMGFFVYSVNMQKNAGFLKFVVLVKALRGRGMGVQMLQQVAEFAFEVTGVSKVQMNVFDVNESARRCYEKAGFVEDDFTPDAFAFNGESWGRCHMIMQKP